MSSTSMSIPKKFSISFTIAKVTKRMTKPVKAFVSLDLALSSLVLSPPDVIHAIAPVIIRKKKTKDPIIKDKVTSEEINFPKNETPLSDLILPSAGFVIGFA